MLHYNIPEKDTKEKKTLNFKNHQKRVKIKRFKNMSFLNK